MPRTPSLKKALILEGVLRKACRVLDRQGVDAVIKHPNSIRVEKNISSRALEDVKKAISPNCDFEIAVRGGMLLITLKRDSRFNVVNSIKTTINNNHTVCVGKNYVMLTIWGEHSLRQVNSLLNEDVVDIRMSTTDDDDAVTYTFLFK